jgi:hypothetical protein
MTPEHMAAIILLECATDGAKKINELVASCDRLAGKDSTLSDSAKKYFADQSLLYQQAQVELGKLRLELMKRVK